MILKSLRKFVVNEILANSNTTFTACYSHGPCAQGYNFIPIAFGIMLYAVYIMECWHNRVKISKIKKVHHLEALEYIEKMREAAPIVWWKSICYHYVRRTRQVTRLVTIQFTIKTVTVQVR
ncbi:unnamed protein product [Anisakis simplex]|uniref:Transmembrane protein 151 homolog (inferred by orthology to a C. elegans protein) n=1 Tax=Anisakis simplex TaxID=6269 RepID=A0A0M3KD86_ANISI|nr:unnamed protein product [Anisakis simplex]